MYFAVISVLSIAVISWQVDLVSSSPNPAYVCSFCSIGLGLVEQEAFQIRLESFLNSKCPSSEATACATVVHRFVQQLESKVPPDDICLKSGLCENRKFEINSYLLLARHK